MTMGDVNNQLLAFEQQLENGKRNHHVTKQMVLSIFSKLTFPYAQFATTAITADFLYPFPVGCDPTLRVCSIQSHFSHWDTATRGSYG